MPASRCVVQDCNNGSNPREGISLHNSPPSGSVLSSWKDSCPHIARTSTKPAVLLLDPSISLMAVLPCRSYHFGGSMKRLVQGAIHSVWKKKMKTIYFLFIGALLHKLTTLSFARRKHGILVHTYSVFRHTYNLCLHVHVLICFMYDQLISVCASIYLVSVLIKRYKHFNVHFYTVKDISFSMHVRVTSCAM